MSSVRPKMPLPVDEHLPALLDLLRKHSSVVVSAEPGAGKTTRIPTELLKLTDKAVWVLEPRRIAAIAASQRIAEENGFTLGKQVGYQVRFENRSSRETRLLFLTEALLLRKMLQDPELKTVGCVVLDEFHERSLHVDLALGALRELQELSRPDLKIVVMSATLNAEPLARYLGDAPVVNIPGKLFPLDLRYEKSAQLLRTGTEFIERMRSLIQKAAGENEGDLLCFVPGRGEIERLRETLSAWAQSRDFVICALHGQLSLQEQKLAIEPAQKRKIILATNVAESSLTVEGVRVVVDCGLARISEVHPRTGFASMNLVRISKASGKQRAGRAARRGPGIVYRAWCPHDELSMKDFETAEIFRSDLSETLMLLSALGVTNAQGFSWFEKPETRALEQARSFLLALGAVTADGSLSDLGRNIREIPLHPRIAKLLLQGEEKKLGAFAAELAALLSEPSSPLPSSDDGENDLWLRWEDWKSRPSHPKHKTLTRTADQLFSLLRQEHSSYELSDVALEREAISLLLAAYPDRLCRRRRANDPQAKMAGGRGVRLHPQSSVKQSEFFLALEIKEGRDASEATVFEAVGISPQLISSQLLPLATLVTKSEWDEEKERFFILETEEWNKLSIGREHRRPASATEMEGALAPVAFARWQILLNKNTKLAAWIDRLHFLSNAGKFPRLSQENIQTALDLACFGETELNALFEKNLIPYFESQLSEEHRAHLNRECPESWVVPSGSRIRIAYSETQGPQLEVRLQELFGLKATPKIGGQPLTLVLLAPNFRPVQVTRDIESFWKNGYLEVRKELRARYPKHSWPEDPLTAPPQAKGKRTTKDVFPAL